MPRALGVLLSRALSLLAPSALAPSALALSALALSPLALSACAGPGGDGPYFGKVAPPEGQTLRYISGSEPESLDPQVATGQPEARIILSLFDGLTEYAPRTGEPIPALAERWDVNGDSTEFTFHLRTNARWSDGTPITADDIVYSLRRGLSPALASRNAYLAYGIENAQAYNEGAVFARERATGAFVPDPANPRIRLTLPADPEVRGEVLARLPGLADGQPDLDFVPVQPEDVAVVADDAHTVRVRMALPVPYFLGLVAHQFFRPVPRQAIETWGERWTDPAHIVTSGAFLLERWLPYNEINVVRNPGYWDEVRLERISFYTLEDVTTMLNLYKAGEVDALYNHTVPAAWVDTIRPYKDYMDAPEASVEYLLFNVERPPMDDIRVRKAFNMAVDKVALAQYRRTAKPLSGFTPEGIFPGYPQPTGDPFDPDRARALLAEAGYAGRDGAWDPSTFPIADVALTYNTAETNRQLAEFVQAQWKQNLGLTVPLRNLEFRTFLTVRNDRDYSGLARGGWAGDYLDPFTFLELFSTPAGNNGTGWFDPRYAAMLDAANREGDPAARYARLADAEAYLLDAQPIVPLLTMATNWVKKPYVKGLFANPVTMHAWKFVYIEHDPSNWDLEDPTPR